MPQPDNRRERGAKTQLPAGNTVAPSGVSGQFDQTGAAMVGGLASVFGNTEPQIKIGQQGRILDSGTSLYSALEGAARGGVQGIMQYDKMYRYTSEKNFNDWDVSRLAYAETVNNDSRQMSSWLADNKFKPNDVTAKKYYSILADASQKDYQQYEIERYNKLTSSVASLDNVDAQEILAAALAETDSASPIYTRLSSQVNNLNAKLVEQGITTRVARQTVKANNDLFTIGEKLRGLNVQPTELSSERGRVIATAIAYFGNDSIDSAGPGIAVSEDGSITYKAVDGTRITGSFNGGLDDPLFTAVRDDLGSMIDANNTEQFALISAAFKSTWHVQHTNTSGTRRPGSTSADTDMKFIPIMAAAAAGDPEALRKALAGAMPTPLTTEMFPPGTTQDSVDNENRELFAGAYDEMISRLNNVANSGPQGEDPRVFYERMIKTAHTLELISTSKDFQLQRNYGFEDGDDPYAVTSNKIRDLRRIKHQAVSSYASSWGEFTDALLKEGGTTPTQYNQILASREDELISLFTEQGIPYDIYRPTPGEDGRLTYVPETSDIRTADAQQNIIVLRNVLTSNAPAMLLTDENSNGTAVIVAGSSNESTQVVVANAWKRQKKAQIDRDTTQRVWDKINGREPTGGIAEGDTAIAVNWFVQAAVNNPTNVGHTERALRFLTPNPWIKNTATVRKQAAHAISSNAQFKKIIANQFSELAMTETSTLIAATPEIRERFAQLAIFAGHLTANGDPSMVGMIIDSVVPADQQLTVETRAGGYGARHTEERTVRLMYESVYAVSNIRAITMRLAEERGNVVMEQWTAADAQAANDKNGLPYFKFLADNGLNKEFATQGQREHSDYVNRVRANAAISNDGLRTRLGSFLTTERELVGNEIREVIRNKVNTGSSVEGRFDDAFGLASEAFERRFGIGNTFGNKLTIDSELVVNDKNYEKVSNYERALIGAYGNEMKNQALTLLTDANILVETNLRPEERGGERDSRASQLAVVSPLVAPFVRSSEQKLLPEANRSNPVSMDLSDPVQYRRASESLVGSLPQDPAGSHPIFVNLNKTGGAADARGTGNSSEITGANEMMERFWNLFTGTDVVLGADVNDVQAVRATLDKVFQIKHIESQADGEYVHIGLSDAVDLETMFPNEFGEMVYRILATGSGEKNVREPATNGPISRLFGSEYQSPSSRLSWWSRPHGGGGDTDQARGLMMAEFLRAHMSKLRLIRYKPAGTNQN